MFLLFRVRNQAVAIKGLFNVCQANKNPALWRGFTQFCPTDFITRRQTLFIAIMIGNN